MCIDMQRRSLRGRVHDRMYEYFEENDLCTRFVQNTDFQKWMRGQDPEGDLRAKAMTDADAYEQLVVSVETFVEKYGWEPELEKHCVSGVFQLLQEQGFLDKVERFRTFKVCRAALYYHLGMMVLDHAT